MQETLWSHQSIKFLHWIIGKLLLNLLQFDKSCAGIDWNRNRTGLYWSIPADFIIFGLILCWFHRYQLITFNSIRCQLISIRFDRCTSELTDCSNDVVHTWALNPTEHMFWIKVRLTFLIPPLTYMIFS